MKYIYAFLFLVLFSLNSNSQVILAGAPPAYNIDLSRWKLTLPTCPMYEIYPPSLTNQQWSLPGIFDRGANGELILTTPTAGCATANSSYPRTEFRGMLSPWNDRTNWTFNGTHILNGTCAINKLPSSKKIIIAQIHGKTGTLDPYFKMYHKKGKIVAEIDGDNYEFGKFDLNKLINYSVIVKDFTIEVIVNGKTSKVIKIDENYADCTFYFKAGLYCIDNSKDDDWARVTYYALEQIHQF
jgi:hypothetical protein